MSYVVDSNCVVFRLTQLFDPKSNTSTSNVKRQFLATDKMLGHTFSNRVFYSENNRADKLDLDGIDFASSLQPTSLEASAQ